MKLGDKIHSLTQKLGIRECGGCKKRREALNALGENPKAFEVLKALFQQEEAENGSVGEAPHGERKVAGPNHRGDDGSSEGADGGGER